jgi:hypothetical protein
MPVTPKSNVNAIDRLPQIDRKSPATLRARRE